MTRSSDSPASPLANSVSNKDDKPKLVILSGPSGAGKRTWCQGFADRARAAGIIVGGFISPPVFINGQKVGIDIVDQLSGERRCLAVRRTVGDDDTDSPTLR